MKKPAKRKVSGKTNKVSIKSGKKSGHWVSDVEFDRLTNSLQEAQDTLDAIRNGEVDALVVHGPRGNQIYSLSGADQPYRVYVEKMQEGAVTISDLGLILYANQRFADMVNLPLEKVIGTEAVAYLANAWPELHNIFKSKKEVIKCESLLERTKGNALPVNLTASHLPLSDQNVICLVVTDLSAQRHSEELRLAKEVAERANEAKDSFLAALSHELRTPLNPALLLASEAANNPALTPEVRSDFATICNSIELEARLIDDLLDLTRIINGKLALNFDIIDCRDALTDAIETIRAEIEQKKISFVLKIDKHPCLVKADTLRLKQALWNILKNAVKFTPAKGQIKVDIHAVTTKGHVAIQVMDTGIGLTQKEIGDIFETFAQGEHAQTYASSPFGGLGLGLSISKKIIKLHSGDIHAQSEGRGRGATFTVELPLAKTPAKAKNGAQVPHASAKAAEERPRYDILLVEDHEPTRKALSHLLNRRQHSVTAVGSAAEARARAEKHEFDLVISDVGLPDSNGFELMKDLQSLYKLRGIALTGYGMENDIVSSHESGFSTHLTKPVRVEALDAALAEAMGE
ncbi:MAG TPA: ATP-binding protein [Verrucomicrobiae bacterium]